MKLATSWLVLVAAVAQGGDVRTSGPGSPRPPIEPIKLMTEVGAVASTCDKIEVDVLAIIDGDKTRLLINLKDRGLLGVNVQIDSAEVPAFAANLLSASEALFEGGSFDEKTGKVHISIRRSELHHVIDVTFASEGLSFRSRKITIDGDNAASLARVLRRGQNIADWLKPRLRAFDPKVDVEFKPSNQTSE